MVKCAAYNCRSGYKPTNWRKKFSNQEAAFLFIVQCFHFQTRCTIKKFETSGSLTLKENNWNPDNSFGVCELHFRKENFWSRYYLEENERCWNEQQYQVYFIHIQSIINQKLHQEEQWKLLRKQKELLKTYNYRKNRRCISEGKD